MKLTNDEQSQGKTRAYDQLFVKKKVALNYVK